MPDWATESRNSEAPSDASADRQSSRSPSPKYEDEEEGFPQTQFDGNTEGLYEALEILDERKPRKTGKNKVGLYLLRWGGVDPDTGEPWEPSWGPKNGTTPDLVSAWKAKLARDPSILGVEGKKWDEVHEKRKREEKARLSREKSAKAAARKSASLKRKRESMVSSSGKKARASSGRQSSTKSVEPTQEPSTPATAPSRQRSTRTSSVAAAPSAPPTPLDSARPFPHPRTSTPRKPTYQEPTRDSSESSDEYEESHPPAGPSKPIFSKKKIISISSSTNHATVHLPAPGRMAPPAPLPARAGPGPSASAAAREKSPAGSRRPLPPKARVASPARPRVRDPSPELPDTQEIPPSSAGKGATESEIGSYGSQPWMRGDVPVPSQRGKAPSAGPKGKTPADTKGKKASEGKLVEKDGMLKMVYSSSDDSGDDDEEDDRVPPRRDEEGDDSQAEEELDTMMDDDYLAMAPLEPLVPEEPPVRPETTYPCGWKGCGEGYETAKALRAHVEEVHIGLGSDAEDAEPNPTDSSADLDAITRARRELSLELHSARDDVSRLTTSESRLEAESARLSHKVKTLTAQLATATLREQDSDTLQVRLNAAEDRREVAEARLSEAEEKAKKVDGVMKGLEDRLAKAVAELEEVKRQLAAAERKGDPGAFGAELEALKREHGETVEELKEKLREAELQNSDAEAHILDRTGDLNAALAQTKSLQQQLAEAEELRDQHMAERDALQAELDEAREVSSASATEITSLTEQLARAERVSEMHESSAGFLRTQYDEARERVFSADRTNEELKQQISVLREQLSLGLAQRQVFSASVAAQRDAESAKLRAQIRVLLEQARRTDDDVRKKAAFFTAYSVERDILVSRAAQKDARISELEDENYELVDKVEELVQRMDILRAVKMGVIRDPDAESSEEGSPMGLLGNEELPEVGGTEEVFNIDPRPSVPAEGKAWPCKWVFEGGEVCGCLCDTVEELYAHSTSHQATEMAERKRRKEAELLQEQDS
ncbi:hypothetical protein IAT38_004300 [Cryptococcus sp. DSM 104549]